MLLGFPRLLALLVCLWIVVGCGPSGAPAGLTNHLQSRCEVSFRRGDALGSGAALPVSPLTDEVNGAQVSIRGILSAVDAQGILLYDEKAKRNHWIPFTAILRISFPLG